MPLCESFCKKVEKYEEVNKEKLAGRISFLGVKSVDWTKAQLDVLSIDEIYREKVINRHPFRQELIRGNSDAKNY